MTEIDELLALQDGVISRRQVLAAGRAANDIRRWLRQRRWASVHPGVYVHHTGPLTWRQRAWAGVLYAAPAALCHDSALRAVDGPGRADRRDDDPIHVAVDRKRRFSPPPGVVAHHLAGLDSHVRWNASPPRVRIEEALVDLAAEATSELRAIGVLADAVQARRTTASRLLDTLGGRARIARRAFLDGVLRDIDTGACSVLEHGYLTRVERPHSLPPGERQASGAGPIRRDVLYRQQQVVVELDGRAFHDNAGARGRDLDRDLAAAVEEGLTTTRLGWGQVFDHACTTALRIGLLLQRRGWAGTPVTCPKCPTEAMPSNEVAR